MDTAVRSAVRNGGAGLRQHKENDRFGHAVEFAHRLSRQLGGFRVPPRFD